MPAIPSKKPTGFDYNTLGALPLNDAIDLVVGATATLLTCPSGASILVVKAETDDWLLAKGDKVSSFPTDPATTTAGGTAGNALWPIKAAEALPQRLYVGGNKSVTVKGPQAGSKLRYFWL